LPFLSLTLRETPIGEYPLHFLQYTSLYSYGFLTLPFSSNLPAYLASSSPASPPYAADL
jgi:hypothetical protein